MPSITITFTVEQGQRIQSAFASRYGVPFDVAAYKDWVIARTKDVVLDEEKDTAVRAVQQSHTPTPLDLT